MLTKGDDFPIHQTSDPIAYSGTDRNFYDRYFFNGYAPDGSDFFAVAFGVYPHVNVADAHFAVIRDSVEHCVHASRVLGMERLDIEVGPIRIEVIEPLKKLKVTVVSREGISAEIVFEGRAFPIEEPRFIQRVQARTLMDYTRLTQNGRYSGWIEVDGKRRALAGGTVGTRDRSWGVRSIGMPDPQPLPPIRHPQFFWLWSPLNFEKKSVFYHLNADAEGRPWNTRAVVCPDGAGPHDMIETSRARMEIAFKPGTRNARRSVLTIEPDGHAPLRVTIEPLQNFQMRGIGYFHPEWMHGVYKGELVVARENIVLAKVDPTLPQEIHVQAISRVALEEDGKPAGNGLGVLEQLILGPYAPYGFHELLDVAP